MAGTLTPHPTPGLVARSVRLYRRLLVLYPLNFRRAFAAEMTQVFQAHCAQTYWQGGLPAVYMLWVSTLFDLLKTALHERLTEGFKMQKNPFSISTTVLALLGGAIALILVFANWRQMPYPFPSNASVLLRYWSYRPVDEEVCLQMSETSFSYAPYYYPDQLFLPPGDRSPMLEGAEQFVPPGQQPTVPSPIIVKAGGRAMRIYTQPHYSCSPWGPDFFIQTISLWRAHASIFSLALPLLWFVGLLGLVVWARVGKLGVVGLSVGMVGCLIMAVNLFQAIQSSGSIQGPWALFSWGYLSFGAGLLLFGVDAFKHKWLPRWNALPLIIGCLVIALEATNMIIPNASIRFLENNSITASTTVQSWLQAQAVVLMLINLLWLLLWGLHFTDRRAQLSPASV